MREKKPSFPRKKALTTPRLLMYNIRCCQQGSMRSWRNWHTRTFEGRVLNRVRVQVPSIAPKSDIFPQKMSLFLWFKPRFVERVLSDLRRSIDFKGNTPSLAIKVAKPTGMVRPPYRMSQHKGGAISLIIGQLIVLQ